MKIFFQNKRFIGKKKFISLDWGIVIVAILYLKLDRKKFEMI